MFRRSCLILLALLASSRAWHDCGNGGGICPDGNTCCFDPATSVTSCISGKKELGECCSDGGGCSDGYKCNNGGCIKTDAADDDKPDHTPRYKTCTVTAESLQQVHGLPMPIPKHPKHPGQPNLAYLSNMGALDAPEHLQEHLNVKTVIITIHGSGRNADDYLCGTQGAVPADQVNSTLIIAPWFRAPNDPSLPPVQTRLLRKNDKEQPYLLKWAEFGPIFHTWRYGADAINADISSYMVLDKLILYILQSAAVRFPNLKRMVVIGHSAGGQYVQRWSLLSQFSGIHNNDSLYRYIPVRAIVANPKSFCFLDARRYSNGILQIPDSNAIDACPTYDGWEWGLGDGDYLPTPYKDHAFAQVANNKAALVARYAQRNVVYLAGELDTIPNGDCEAKMQGEYRRERSEHFYASLQDIYSNNTQQHYRMVVKNVHHDHCLIYQSPEGYEAIWGNVTLPNI